MKNFKKMILKAEKRQIENEYYVKRDRKRKGSGSFSWSRLSCSFPSTCALPSCAIKVEGHAAFWRYLLVIIALFIAFA